jgi:hypothetical protein
MCLYVLYGLNLMLLILEYSLNNEKIWKTEEIL